MNKLRLTLCLSIISASLFAQKTVQVSSPSGTLNVEIVIGKQITYRVQHQGETVLFPSVISMQIADNKNFGDNSMLKKTITNNVNKKITSPFYKRAEITDTYNEVVLVFKEDFNLVFRAYDEGMAYRFVSTGKKDFIVENEEANFELGTDNNAFVPYIRPSWMEKFDHFENSFENTYSYQPLSRWENGRLAFLPLLVERNNGKKLCITEADLESYPGMFIQNPSKNTNLKGCFAPLPKRVEQGGYNQLQWEVKERETYLARCKANMSFPWRVVIVSSKDKELADNDMVYKLASPSRVQDISWIKPGKVAWEWWNNWNLFNVDFETGVNNQTYKYYIDFAAKSGIEYIIMDEGWSVRGKNLLTVVPEIDLKELVDYAAQRNVGIILWAGYYFFDKDMEAICKHYSEMGIKGFKVDFMDRDDQLAVDFHYRCAKVAAEHQLLIDFHGTYKPTGLNRTYPNVLNFEGVYGLEQMKFDSHLNDQVIYDVTIPYIRQIAGAMDYTQGAMRNANKENFKNINTEPMSMGTRCRQLALYIILEAPLTMLCDSPSNYELESECTGFIAAVPTVWDNTVALDGEIAKYTVTARKSGSDWYVGGITDWTERTLELDLSFLGEGNFSAEIFRDGVNANKAGRDYKKETIVVPGNKKMSIRMAQGGGFAMKITKNK